LERIKLEQFQKLITLFYGLHTTDDLIIHLWIKDQKGNTKIYLGKPIVDLSVDKKETTLNLTILCEEEDFEYQEFDTSKLKLINDDD